MAGLLLPALNKAREKARTISCAGNLKSWSLGMINYQNDFNSWQAYYFYVSVNAPANIGEYQESDLRWNNNPWMGLYFNKKGVIYSKVPHLGYIDLPCSGWAGNADYIAPSGIGKCPSEPDLKPQLGTHYMINTLVPGGASYNDPVRNNNPRIQRDPRTQMYRTESLQNPSRLPMVFDGYGYDNSRAIPRHNGSVNIAFVGGNIGTFSSSSMKREISGGKLSVNIWYSQSWYPFAGKDSN